MSNLTYGRRSQEETEFSILKHIYLARCSWDGSRRPGKILKATLVSLGINKADSKRES